VSVFKPEKYFSTDTFGTHYFANPPVKILKDHPAF